MSKVKGCVLSASELSVCVVFERVWLCDGGLAVALAKVGKLKAVHTETKRTGEELMIK